MKALLFLVLASCSVRYTSQLEAQSSPPLTASVEGDPIVVVEGTAINTRIGIRENGNFIEIKEDDVTVTIKDPTLARILPGPKPLELAILGMASGETTLQVRYRGDVVEEKTLQISAQ